MTDYQQDADGFWPAASGRTPYRPASSLSADAWTDRMQDALTDFRDTHTGARISPSERGAGAQEAHDSEGRRIYRPSISRDIECSCGCGEEFTPTRAGQQFKDATHRKRAHRAKVTA